MSVVAIYSMKGGVGKSTATVNLAYLAAAEGRRVLIWDLDPQAASTFAFRVQPRVAGFGRKALESAHTLAAAIKATDYEHLDLLPADFAYRKLDRLIERVGDPEQVMATLLERLGHEYDVVLLDCPAGFSLLIEGVLTAADAVLVPTIPTVFSLRTLLRIGKWADRSGARLELAAFFSMVDRRKSLHRRICEGLAGRHEMFLEAYVPYASVVEEMALRRTPLGVFAPREAATAAFAGVWTELQTRLRHRRGRNRGGWVATLRDVDRLIGQLDSQGTATGTPPPAPATAASGGVQFVHSFDTDGRDLARHGWSIELREYPSRLLLAVEGGVTAEPGQSHPRAEIPLDNSTAVELLSGALSPLQVLERAAGPAALLAGRIRAATGERRIRLIESRVGTPDPGGNRQLHRQLRAVASR